MVILSDSAGSSSRICRVCQTGLAVERLREKQQPHRPRHLREVVAQPFLIGGRISDIVYPWIPHRRSASPASECVSLEQIVERLARARRSGGRAGLTLDGGARLEQRAGFRSSFGATRAANRLRALPSCARVERHAVDAAVNIDAASRAPRVQLRPAPPADCRSARSGRPRATPSGSASSVPRHPAAGGPGRAVRRRLRSARSPAVRDREDRPDSRAGDCASSSWLGHSSGANPAIWRCEDCVNRWGPYGFPISSLRPLHRMETPTHSRMNAESQRRECSCRSRPSELIRRDANR